jgi:hypothetical protein
MKDDLDLEALEHVSGGLKLGAIPHLPPGHLTVDVHSPLGFDPHAASLPARVGAVDVTAYFGFGAATVAATDAQHGMQLQHGRHFKGDDVPADLSDHVSLSTNGAIVYLGDANGDGRLGTADFLHSAAISEDAAAKLVGNILDQPTSGDWEAAAPVFRK